LVAKTARKPKKGNLMNKLAVIVSLFTAGALIASCTPEATEQELNSMCGNLVNLRGEVELLVLEEANAEVEKVFAKRAAAKKRAAELENEDWDAELEMRLKELKKKMEAEEPELDAEGEEIPKPTEEDVQALKDKYAAKKVETIARYEEFAKSLPEEKQLALADTVQKVEQSKVDFKKAVDECLDMAKKNPVTQKLAQCRIKAKSKDEFFNRCEP
jgi:hypothetical protein